MGEAFNMNAANGGRRLELEDLAAVRPASAGNWSPDGRAIAYFKADREGRTELWLVSPEGPATAQCVGAGPVDPEGTEGTDRRDVLGGPQWSPDGTRIAYTAPAGRPGGRSVWAVPVDGGAPVELAPDHRGLDRTPRWAPDGERLAMVETMYGRDDLCVIGPDQSSPLQLTYDRWDNTEPDWSPLGTTLAYISQRSDRDVYSNSICSIALKAGSQPAVLTHDEFANDRCPRWSPDGRRLVFISNSDGFDNVYTMASDGSDVLQLTSTEQDCGDPRWSPDGRWILYTQFRYGDVDVFAVPATGGEPVGIACGEVNVAPRWSPDGRRVLFHRSGPSHPGDLWVVGWADGHPAGEARCVTEVAGGRLDDIAFSSPHAITYESTGGVTISALLYDRIDSAEESGPGILYVRGGPNAVNVNGWVPQLQFLAQRGYTLLVPDYRGSTGYGKAFMEANRGTNPGLDIDDWVAGAGYLKSLPTVDGSRLLIMGRSYGGYAGLIMLGLYPKLFKAAVATAAPSNWFTYWEHTHLAWCRRLQTWTIGTPHNNPELTRARSPIVYAEGIRSPVIIIQGEEDVGNPVEQAWEMSTRLTDLERPHECHIYPGEGHVFVGADAIIDSNRRIEAFLAEHL